MHGDSKIWKRYKLYQKGRLNRKVKIPLLSSVMSLFPDEGVFDDHILTETDLVQMDHHNLELNEVRS